MLINRLKMFVRDNLELLKKYMGSGVLSVVIDYVVLVTLTELFGIYYLYSVTASYFSGFFANFFFNKYWTFRKKENTFAQMIKYSILAGMNYIFTLSVMYSLTSMFGINYLISRGAVLILVTCWNFLLYRYVVYK